jgi:hypothetical protein
MTIEQDIPRMRILQSHSACCECLNQIKDNQRSISQHGCTPLCRIRDEGDSAVMNHQPKPVQNIIRAGCFDKQSTVDKLLDRAVLEQPREQ